MNTKAQIFDITGKECYSGVVENGLKLDISGLVPGFYLVKIEEQLIKMIRK